MFLTKKIKILFFLFLACSVSAFCQDQFDVFYYGIIADSAQVNQINISQDLFAAQIRAIPELNLVDFRNNGLKESFLSLSDAEIKNIDAEKLFSLISDNEKLKASEKAVIFFCKIDKTEDETWDCTYYTKNLSTNKIDSVSKNFETFYKILADARNTIGEILSSSCEIELTKGQTQARAAREPISDVAMTVEGVSGTWSGEKNITKIILMRSGRGFVIFSNGASMNITIEIEQAQNSIPELTDNVQYIDLSLFKFNFAKELSNGNFNASFYPDIPRQKVLAYADNATPIEWTFMLTGSGTLSGFKNTLGLDDSESIGPKTERVEWKKLN